MSKRNDGESKKAIVNGSNEEIQGEYGKKKENNKNENSREKSKKTPTKC